MKFKIWLENIFSGVHSKEDLIQTLKTADRQTVLNWIEEINKQHYAKLLGTNNPVVLYHGSPQDDLEQIKITKGRRGGPFGSNRTVQNLGIFMTDSKEMARFFGNNRSDNGRSTLYSTYANLDRVLDSSKMPLILRKLGLSLVNSYYGTKKGKLAESDIWWLLDHSEFVSKVKELGYNCVKFKESIDIRRQSSKMAFTYFIIDPSHVMIRRGNNDLIKNLDSLWEYLKGTNDIRN